MLVKVKIRGIYGGPTIQESYGWVEPGIVIDVPAFNAAELITNGLVVIEGLSVKASKEVAAQVIATETAPANSGELTILPDPDKARPIMAITGDDGMQRAPDGTLVTTLKNAAKS